MTHMLALGRNSEGKGESIMFTRNHAITGLAFYLFLCLPSLIYADICSRTPPIRNEILKQINAIKNKEITCEEVRRKHLNKIKNLVIRRASTQIEINGKKLHRSLPPLVLDPRDFDGLSKLKSLDLDNNQITSLPDGIFNGLSKLEIARS